MSYVTSIFIILCYKFIFAEGASNCNEAVCGSLVSKCMLIKSCGCDMQNNCTCCKDCYKCLQTLYTECCSCVGMCPDSLAEASQNHLKSSIEDLPSSIHELFDVLTQEEDHLKRWMIYRYPVFEDLKLLSMDLQKLKKHITPKLADKQIKVDSTIYLNDSSIIFEDPVKDVQTDELMKAANEDVIMVDQTVPTIDETTNCTVLYMSDCMSMHKCRMTCYSMGASKYRWFHNACCECVGYTCIGYGKNESKCLKCPKSKDLEQEMPYVMKAEDEL